MTLVSIQPICIGMVQAPFLFELCTRAHVHAIILLVCYIMIQMLEQDWIKHDVR